MEYIEREAAIEKLNRLCDRVCQYSKAQRQYMCGACPLGDAFTVIEDDIPAADVAPVVRGKWKQDELSKRLDLYVCSECGQPLQIVNADGGKTATAYCPNCGADMREESDGKD